MKEWKGSLCTRRSPKKRTRSSLRWAAARSTAAHRRNGSYAEDLPPPTPTRAPGLAGELARAQALLRDAAEEQRRLEAALGAARDAAAVLPQREGDLMRRARHRRELHFVQSGIDAASAREAAAASGARGTKGAKGGARGRGR